MATEIVSANIDAETLESVVLGGDLSRLKPKARLEYYAAVCKSLKLNPLTKPFEYIPLQGKLILYATKNCTEQLSEKMGISIELGEGKILGDSYVVKARATGPDGRFVDATGAVPIGKRQGEDHSNSLMKAETKASRRAVLRYGGLGWLDETEVETIKGAEKVEVDHSTGELQDKMPTETSEPLATSKQQGFLKSLGYAENTTTLTRKEASSLIEKLKTGEATTPPTTSAPQNVTRLEETKRKLLSNSPKIQAMGADELIGMLKQLGIPDTEVEIIAEALRINPSLDIPLTVQEWIDADASGGRTYHEAAKEILGFLMGEVT